MRLFIIAPSLCTKLGEKIKVILLLSAFYPKNNVYIFLAYLLALYSLFFIAFAVFVQY